MRCLILASGKGSRLKSLGEVKPLVRVLGIPLIERVIRYAIVAKGEGVFFEFDNELLGKWLSNSATQESFNL